MDHDSKAPVIARVDLEKVRIISEEKLGIDFFNEIDIWAQMEFRSREQISKLRQKKTPAAKGVLKELNSLYYSVREKME